MKTSNSSQLPMNTSDAGSLDVSDDEELMELLEQDKRRSERLRIKLDSTASMSSSSAPDCPKTSVFGAEMARHSKQRDRQMQAILRDRNKRKKIEQENHQLRIALSEDKVKQNVHISEEEKFFADMAEAEIRNEKERQRRYEKYNCAIALFLRPPDWPAPSKSKWQPRISQDLHPVQEMLQLAHKEGCNLHQRFPALVKTVCERKQVLPQHIARMLFYRVVYDPLDVTANQGREHELQGLLEYIPYACTSNSGKFLPSMSQVLRNYGAVLSVKATSPDAIQKAPKQSIDRKVMNVGNELSGEMQKNLRNLSRAFKIWTLLVKCGADYSGILGESRTAITGHVSSKTHCCLRIGELCVHVLLSPFGSRLDMAVEPFLTTLFSSIERTEWIAFRQRFGIFIAQYTSRLGLHVDLVEYILPSCCERSQTLRLDAAFMILQRWCSGSTVSKDVLSYPLSNGGISFRLSDVLACMNGIPELTTETDEVWLLLLARLLRILIVDFRVLATKKKGQLAKIQAWEKKMRWSSHRNLPHGVEKHSFQYCLNALITSLGAFVGNAEKKELKLI